MSMSLVCVSIKVFCAARCDGSSLDSVLKIIPDVRGRRTGRVCLQNQASTHFTPACPISGRSAWPAPEPQPAVSSVCSLRVNTWPQPPLASLNPGSQTGSLTRYKRLRITRNLVVIQRILSTL